MQNVNDKKKPSIKRDKVLKYANQELPEFPRNIAGLEEYSDNWNFESAAHLLRRTCFGPKLSEINKAITLGLNESIDKLFYRTRSKFLGDEVKKRILLGTYVLSSGYYDAYYKKALKVRRIITDDLVNHFNDIDLLLMPTTPTTAFSKGAKIGKAMDMYLSDIFTVPISLAGVPSLNVPIGSYNKMPVGIQISGNYFKENNILYLSNLIESKFLK